MTVTLDHTIVHASDNLASAGFLADILAEVLPHHYAFTVVRAGGRRRIASCHIGPLDARTEAS